jgi:hypothetical protein
MSTNILSAAKDQPRRRDERAMCGEPSVWRVRGGALADPSTPLRSAQD